MPEICPHRRLVSRVTWGDGAVGGACACMMDDSEPLDCTDYGDIVTVRPFTLLHENGVFSRDMKIMRTTTFALSTYPSTAFVIALCKNLQLPFYL